MTFEVYLRAVQDLFTEARGASLFLSPRDVELVRRWHADGVPLEAVARGIQDGMEAASHGKRIKRGRSVGLIVCEPHVLRHAQAREPQFESVAPPSPPEQPAPRDSIGRFFDECRRSLPEHLLPEEPHRRLIALLESEEGRLRRLFHEERVNQKQMAQAFYEAGRKLLAETCEMSALVPREHAWHGQGLKTSEIPALGPTQLREKLSELGYPGWYYSRLLDNGAT